MRGGNTIGVGKGDNGSRGNGQSPVAGDVGSGLGFMDQVDLLDLLKMVGDVPDIFLGVVIDDDNFVAVPGDRFAG